MIRSILSRLGLGGLLGRRETVTTVKLEIIAEQVRNFNETKRQLNDKINNLESKTQELDLTVSKTLALTRENQNRLSNIEDSLERIITMSEAVIGGQPEPTRPLGSGVRLKAGDAVQKPSEQESGAGDV